MRGKVPAELSHIRGIRQSQWLRRVTYELRTLVVLNYLFKESMKEESTIYLFSNKAYLGTYQIGYLD